MPRKSLGAVDVDQMNKRRSINVNATSSTNNQPLFSSYEKLIMHMKCNDPVVVYLATQVARKMLDAEHNPPIENLIEHGIVPICVELLDATR